MITFELYNKQPDEGKKSYFYCLYFTKEEVLLMHFK